MASSSSIKLQDDIKRTVIEFIGDIRDNIFVDRNDIANIAKVEFFFNIMNAQSVTDHIVTHILPYKNKIDARDMQFFVDQKDKIFAGLPPAMVDHFANMVLKPEKQGGLSLYDKNIIWSYFDTLILLAVNYKKLN